MASQPLIISASIMSANLACLGQEADAVIEAGADWLHLDVMDNHYVPNLTFGAPICHALHQYQPNYVLDVHLMTERVDTLIDVFSQAGAHCISFHLETTAHVHRTIMAIRKTGMKVGVALNPATPLSSLECLWGYIDTILLMTVNPGFGGQEFIESTLPKIATARRLIDESGRLIRLQVDGGIDPGNARRCRQAGADTLVSGSAIFSAANYSQVITAMQESFSD